MFKQDNTFSAFSAIILFVIEQVKQVFFLFNQGKTEHITA